MANYKKTRPRRMYCDGRDSPQSRYHMYIILLVL